MGPKKKGKGKKGKKGKVKADPGWARTIEWGYWSRPYESMPSAAVKPAFGVIREEFLEAVKELDMIWSKTLTEDFLVELFSIPRPNLEIFCIRGAYLLKRFVLSPYEVLTGLKRLDIGCMDELQFVLIQCKSLEWLSLARSKSLTKALVEAENLQELVIDNCLKLASLMVWSSQMKSITGLDDSKKLEVLYLDCPTLVNFKRPKLYVVPKPKVFHPTLLALRKWEDKQEPIPDQEFGLLAKDLVVDDDALREDIVYPNVPRFPRTHLQGF
ncbi:hypothetical protein KC19_11G112800 [Ceratodon purpureus]|uniref:Uncharacterized protein n=1 Tax=Ceratodon purpureus TaxID=3225 RepID=A0A8T0GDY3_CERPU|nr:hypothetical protein KC19_11G112800 [Ceratodon purpureus]